MIHAKNWFISHVPFIWLLIQFLLIFHLRFKFKPTRNYKMNFSFEFVLFQHKHRDEWEFKGKMIFMHTSCNTWCTLFAMTYLCSLKFIALIFSDQNILRIGRSAAPFNIAYTEYEMQYNVVFKVWNSTINHSEWRERKKWYWF